MKLLWLSAFLAVAVLSASARVDAKPSFVSQYTNLTSCKEVASGDLDKGQDWVYVRCKGLGNIPVWYTCQDSARCKYGFGSKPNVSGPFGIGREGIIEWRGVLRRGRLEPIAVVIRLPSADPEATSRNSLMVYRLRANGTSCIVGETSLNSDARRIADGSADRFQCVGEPDDPPSD